MPTIVSLGASPNGTIEGLVRQKLRERNPAVSQAEVSAATNTVLADSGYSAADATSLGTNAQVNLTSLEPPPPPPVPAPTPPAADASVAADATATASFVLMPVNSNGKTTMTPVPVVSGGQSFAINGSQSFVIQDGAQAGDAPAPAPAAPAPAAPPPPPTRFALSDSDNGTIEGLVRKKLREKNPAVSENEVMAARDKVMAANNITLDGARNMMPTDQVELNSILPPPPPPPPPPPAPAPAPADTPAEGEFVQGGQRFAIIRNPFANGNNGNGNNGQTDAPAAATPGTNASANFNAFNNLLKQVTQNEDNSSRRRSRSVPSSPLLSQPFSNGNVRLDDIAGLPLPGNFSSAIGVGRPFNTVVGNIGGSSILAQRGLFF